jgi:hypothetical protein
MDFGKYAEYMALGYASMALILGGMVFWLYWRFRMVLREAQMVEELEAEVRAERAAPVEKVSYALDSDATPVIALQEES